VAKELRQKVQELVAQLEAEHADHEKIEAELCELKQNSAPAARLFKKLTLRLATILSPLRAREKIKNWSGQLESYFTNFGKLRQKNFTLMT
jgi:Spy/CpxP family protein refolding chaperone